MHKYPRNPCYQRRGLAGGTISPPLAQLFQPALATTRVRYGVMDDALARQPSLRPTLPPSSFFPSLPSFPRRHPLAWLPPCHGRCRLNNYPHGVLNSSLATWNPSTEFARPLCGTLRLDRAGALRGELLINTSGERERERDGLWSGCANFAAVIIQSVTILKRFNNQRTKNSLLFDIRLSRKISRRKCAKERFYL